MKAMINITTIQEIDGRQEKIELESVGTYGFLNNAYHIIYKETEMTGFPDTTTTIKAEADKVTVTRKGKFSSTMEFILGEKRLCNYPTPFGSFPVAVYPTKIEKRLTDKGGELEIDYILDIDNEEFARNVLRLKISEARG